VGDSVVSDMTHCLGGGGNISRGVVTGSSFEKGVIIYCLWELVQCVGSHRFCEMLLNYCSVGRVYIDERAKVAQI